MRRGVVRQLSHYCEGLCGGLEKSVASENVNEPMVRLVGFIAALVVRPRYTKTPVDGCTHQFLQTRRWLTKRSLTGQFLKTDHVEIRACD